MSQIIELLELYFPQILAGLFPSLIALVPVIITAVKNIKVNNQVKDLLKIVNDLETGNISMGQALDAGVRQINDVKTSVINEFKEVHDLAKDSLAKDVIHVQNIVGQQITSMEQNMAEIQMSLVQTLEKLRNAGAENDEVKE
ncbi:MAG TPA: hypothetical protein VFC62_05045 [Atopostipes sp.]|nr:hypothetical protein [Atopostipes sp.]